ncbi:MAG: methyltransferase domain-containing protein [Clostridia bacterium]|nr:methyltransferase domain-containing protein [Clostridia bacterium]
MSFFENTRKPVGLGGRIMVSMMNLGHRSLAKWGLQYLPLDPDARVLDCGCGGGANIKKLLKICPQGIVKGVDYSAVSAEKARKHNAAAIREGRCVVWQGSVERTIFAAEWFDAVTAFETIYFWPDLPRCFREMYRLLKPGGAFLICNECGGDTEKGEKWAKKIEGMTVYRGIQLHALLAKAGFQHIQVHRNKKGWLCITARK